MAASQAQDQVQALARQAQEHVHGLMHHLHHHKPTSSQVVGFLTFLVGAGAVLLVGGLVLAVLTPVLLVLSPVLIPVGVVVFALTVGAVVVGGSGIAVVSTASWVYNYVKGRHPPGSEQVDNAYYRVQDVADEMRRKARDFAGSLQQNTGAGAEAAPGA